MRILLFLILAAPTLITACSNKTFKVKWTREESPAVFKARFETTKGIFEIEAYRDWAPNGVDRLYQLIKNRFYYDIAIFRVVPGYVVQFGINNDSLKNRAWNKYKVYDDMVKEHNVEFAVSFASGGKDTRTTQLFINLVNNSPRLDTLQVKGATGYPVVAKVIAGMDVIKAFNSVYGNGPVNRQDSIYAHGNDFLKRNYPHLDYVKKAYIIN